MKSQESSMFYSFIKINSNCSCEWNRWGCCVERKRKDCGTLTFQDISGMPLRSRFFFSDIPFPRSSLYKLEIKERKLEERKRFSHYSNPWFRYGKSSAFQRPSVFSARTSFSCLWQRIKFSNKSIKLSSFSLFNTGPLRAAQQKEGDPCGRARGSLSIAIQHVSRGGGGAFVSQQDPALHLQPFRIYRLFIRHSEPQRTFTSSQERHLSNPPGRPPGGCCVPWSVAFFARPAFSFSGQVTDETQKSSQVKS